MANYNSKEKTHRQIASNTLTNCDRLNNQMWETLVEISWAIDGWKYNKPSPEDITRIGKKVRNVIDTLNKQSEELTYIEEFITFYSK